MLVLLRIFFTWSRRMIISDTSRMGFHESVLRLRYHNLAMNICASCFLLRDGWTFGAVVQLLCSKHGKNIVKQIIGLLQICLEFCKICLEFCIEVVPVACEYWMLRIQIYFCMLMMWDGTYIDILNDVFAFFVYYLAHLPWRCPRSFRLLHSFLVFYMVEPHDTCNSSCGCKKKPEKGRPKKNSASVGAFKPPPDLRSHKQVNEYEFAVEREDVPEPLTNSEISDELLEMAACKCSTCKRYCGGCLLGQSGVTYGEATEACRACREVLRSQTGSHYDVAFSHLFRSTITDERKNEMGVVTKIFHSWKVSVGGRNIVVCRSVWATMHGVTKYTMDKFARGYKEGAVNSVAFTSYTEKHVSNMSWNDLESVLFENLPDEEEGMWCGECLSTCHCC
jgi:hypothetical protein